MENRKSKVVLIIMAVSCLVLVVSVFAVGEEPAIDEQRGFGESLGRSASSTPSAFYDRRDKLLVEDNITPGTTLLINEVSAKYPERAEIHLTIDSDLQDQVYGALKKVADSKGYAGGAGVVLDVRTGDLLTLTTYSRDDSAANRATNGLFVPGSAIKPFIAMAALSENLVDPDHEILSTGSLTLTDQNGKKLIYNDWKAHGYVDMRKAIGVSSNVYFYAIGGGYEGQAGLGIERITEYLSLFGLGRPTGVEVISEQTGRIPTPEWKKLKYNGDAWRLGDTYLASIGQHGYEVTPLQMARATVALATRGRMIQPRILRDQRGDQNDFQLPLKKEFFDVVREGMEYSVINGTASGLYRSDFTLAAKTGTAEADSFKSRIHSWLIGYFPHDRPSHAFALLLDSGPWGEETGAVSAAEEIFTWIRLNRREYLSTY